jgi:multidrug efflux pump subunit AcrA (membrane-fusion protein)
MKWLSKKWLIGISVIIILVLLWLVFRQPAVVVEFGTVKRGELTVTINGEGKTRVRDKFVVTAPVSGMMSRIKLKEGDNIPKDFVITEIDPSPPQRPIPPSESEIYPNVYAVKVYSPVSGEVLRIIEKDERVVTAGTPIMEIGNPGNLEIVVDVLSTQATQIKPGAKVLIENWGGSQPLSARVQKIEPQAFTKVSALGVEEQRVNIIADLLDSNVKLGDNFRVETNILTWQGKDVLQVNSSALFRQGEKWNVFVVEGGRARSREVEIGHQSVSETEVIKGLSEGETVILHPSNQITDGISVTSQ